MTEERKRILENKLDLVITNLKEIVEEMNYGVSVMVLPTKDKGINVCAFIHECSGQRGLMRVYGSFVGVLDNEFEYREDEYREDNEDE